MQQQLMNMILSSADIMQYIIIYIMQEKRDMDFTFFLE